MVTGAAYHSPMPCSPRSRDIPKGNTTLCNNDRLLTTAMAGKFLSLSPDRLRQLIRAKKLPAYKFSTGQQAQWRVRQSDLDALLRRVGASDAR